MIFIIMAMTEFSAYAGNEEMLDILNAFPEAMLDALKYNAFNLTTVSGYLGVMYMFYALILCIHASLTGSTIISKEERDKTVEFLLVLPVRRRGILTPKIAAASVNCLGLLLITYAATYISSAKYLPEENFDIFLALCMAAIFLMQITFLSIGILLGSALRQFKRSGYLSISIVVAAYFLSIVIDLSKKLDFLKYITPFKYFDPVYMLNDLKIDTGYILISLGTAAVCLAASYITYNRRDLYI